MDSQPQTSLTNPTHLTRLRHKLAQSPRLFIHQLKIGRKIGLGYGLVLGIASLGTMTGFLIGNQIQQRAEVERELFHDEEKLANSLQIAILEVRSNEQRLVRLLKNPREVPFQYSELKMRIDRARVLLAELQDIAQTLETMPSAQNTPADAGQFLARYGAAADEYLWQIETLLERLFSDPASITSPDRQALLEAFTQSPVALGLDEFSAHLGNLAATAATLEHEAHEKLELAEQTRQRIIAASMLLSAALATFLAFYVSRAIARPLEAVTSIAQRTTKDANFDLQAPVTTADEVGILAHSLNMLIQRVKCLLEEQRIAAEQQQQLQQDQLVQSEKMSSLGHMLAGVAHEINNPVNFIYGNLSHAHEYVEDLLSLIALYQQLVPNPPQAVHDQADEIDLPFLVEDLPKLFQSMKLGADRTRQIVLSLKSFSRLDEANPTLVDLAECLDSTLLILNNRIKRGIHIHRQFDEVPPVEGYSGSLYQVFMNLLSNALDALDERSEIEAARATESEPASEPATDSESAPASAYQPKLTITLKVVERDWVTVTIADNGCGISPENLEKVFETFFTTKPVGVGTGLGLAITRKIVVEKHGGTIHCTSEPHQGTEFAIRLPIRQQTAGATAVPNEVPTVLTAG